MIKHNRIVEILHQDASDRLLRIEGENSAYEDWEMAVSPEDSTGKVYDYLQDERKLAELTK